jgi:hypothetical protein
MAEIAVECGYPASSLKERVYALAGSRGGGNFDRCGVLIYTASAGAQGTLGGLVATAPRFAHIRSDAPTLSSKGARDGFVPLESIGVHCRIRLRPSRTLAAISTIFVM